MISFYTLDNAATALTAKDKEIEALRKNLADYDAAYDGLMKAKETFRAEAHRNSSRAETAERERDEAQFGFEHELRIKKELADALRKAERERDIVDGAICDTARELGCESDNEEILFAIDKLRRERDEARAVLKEIEDGYGPNHGSKFCRDVAARAVIKQGE